MQEHEDKNAGMEQRTEQETAEAVSNEIETAQKIDRKERKMAKRKEKTNRKSRQEQAMNGNDSKIGFWNSRKFQNVVFMTGLLIMTVSIVGALLFLFTMDIDDELSYYGLESVLEETMMTSDYTDSWLFEDAYINEAVTQAEAAHARALFETDGKFDENKTIDLAYVSMLRGETATGITYRLGDLLRVRNTNIETRWLIKPQFDAVLDRKKEDQAALSSWEELNEILMSSMTTGYGANYPQKRCVYFEEVFPTDGESLYVHVDDLDTLAAYTEYLEELIPFVRGMYDKYARAAEEPGNIGIALACPSIGLTYCSFADYEGVREGSYAEISEALYDYVAQKEHGVVYHCGAGTILGGNVDISLFEELGRVIGLHEGDRLYLVLDAEFSQNDSLRRMKDWYETIKITAERLIAVFIIGMILFLIGFVRRTMLEGRSQTQKPRLIDGWFTSILLAVIGLMLVSAIIPLELLKVLGEWYWDYYDSGNTVGIYMNGGGILLVSVLSVFVIASVVSYCFFELVNRLKKRTIYKKSLLRFVLCKCRKAVLWIFRCMQKLLMLVDGKIKWAAGYVLFLIVNLIAVLFAANEQWAAPIVLLAIADLFIGALVIAYFREQDKLREHMEATVQGSRGEPLAADRFHGKNKKTAELINDMDTGISRAVEKSMKDERMRTELIANVSHDIRTPLTSIINYVDLLKKEPIESENAQKYLDVLDEKSARLKQLTEDLVEASRITSGNVSVENVRLSAEELVQQIAAEYEEKFKQKELTLVLHLPEEQADDSFIGDSRYVWRVLSNLFSNLYKYAMPHTRVYFSMYRTPTPTFCMELKNISEYPLNISPEELTERFVRGDASRGTEGNGLGLSIAQSLMNVMHGSLEILIDGDLFKVLLHFPVPPR
ncbi:MAG: hypothetical protein HDR15_10160 [Lachnospiraceae bacterium]|nr:hypothetical protein [Lachnospiraceae bacterium]